MLQDFAGPLIELMKENVRGHAIVNAPVKLWRRMMGQSPPNQLEWTLNTKHFHNRTLSELAFLPLFVFTATDLSAGIPFYLTNRGLGTRGHRIEYAARYRGIPEGSVRTSVARAVAGSACFPPFFLPIQIRLNEKEAQDYRAGVALLGVDEFAQEARPVLDLTDGGVSDNRGISFAYDLLSNWRPTEEEKHPPVQYVMVYDAGQRRAIKRAVLPRLSRAHLLYAVQSRIYAQRETLNDRLLRTLAESINVKYAAHRAIPYLAEEIGVDKQLLDVVLRVRTDLDRFSDTEIFVLAYVGYQLAVMGFKEVKLVSPDFWGSSIGDLLDEFHAILGGILRPELPTEWVNHIRASESRISALRQLRRFVRA